MNNLIEKWAKDRYRMQSGETFQNGYENLIKSNIHIFWTSNYVYFQGNVNQVYEYAGKTVGRLLF